MSSFLPAPVDCGAAPSSTSAGPPPWTARTDAPTTGCRRSPPPPTGGGRGRRHVHAGHQLPVQVGAHLPDHLSRHYRSGHGHRTAGHHLQLLPWRQGIAQILRRHQGHRGSCTAPHQHGGEDLPPGCGGLHMVAGKAVVQQGHVVVPVVAVPEGDAHQGHPIPLSCGHQGPARRLGEPGLNPDAPLAQPQQLVVVGQISVPDGDGGRRDNAAEVLVLQGVGRQRRHIPGAGVMSLRVQTVGVGEVGVGHPQLLRLLVHQRHKGLRLPGDAVRHRQGCVVAADQHESVEQLLQPQHIPGLEVHGGTLRHVLRCDRILLLHPAVLQGHHGGHDLRDAGNEALLVPVLLIQHPPAPLLHQHGGCGRRTDSISLTSKKACRRQKAYGPPPKTASGHTGPPPRSIDGPSMSLGGGLKPRKNLPN